MNHVASIGCLFHVLANNDQKSPIRNKGVHLNCAFKLFLRDLNSPFFALSVFTFFNVVYLIL